MIFPANMEFEAGRERWSDIPTTDCYDGSVFSHDRSTEYLRLQFAEKMLDLRTIEIFERIAVGSSWRCLELGAGAGSIARWLAGRCPEGHVVATDTDTRFLDPSWAPNLEIIRHDVVRDGFTPGSFELIHVRCLLANLSDREDVVVKVTSWLAPGGWLVIEDPDVFPVDSSPHPMLRRAPLGASAAARHIRRGRSG